jgi:trigger factor
LNIEKQPLENHQMKLIVQLENTKLEEARHRAARHISKHKKIPGFRPGKAPYAIIQRTFGDEVILEEALDILVKEIYPKVIEESGVKPYGPGSLENMPKLDPPTFEFIVPLEPEVTLGDYKKIRFPYKLKTVTKKDINKVLEDLRERQVVLEPSDKPASEGDQVYIKLTIKRAQPEKGEIANLVTDRRMPVVITSPTVENKAEWPFPGFSQNLVGRTVSEDVSFRYTYPKISEFKELRGKEVEVELKVEEIKKRILPELSDEFAQAVGEQYSDLASLTEDIRQSLERQTKEEYDNGYNEKIIKQLMEVSELKYPPQMLERETDLFLDQLKNRLAQQKLDMETYLKMRKIDETALRVEIKPQAEDRLRHTLLLLEVAKAENIHVENAELESESMRTLDELGRMMPAEQARKTLTNDFVRGMIGNIGADLLVKHTYEFLQSVARGEKEDSSSEPSPEGSDVATPADEKTEKPKIKRKKQKVEKNEP